MTPPLTAPAPSPARAVAPAPTMRPCLVPRIRRLRHEHEPGVLLPPARPVAVALPVPEPVQGDDSAVRRAVGETLRVALEVLDGRRALAQLAPLLDPSPLRYWRAELGRRRSQGPSRLLRRMRLCTPRPGVVEVAAVCRIDGRVRALAARFEQRDAGWRCTVVRLG